MSDHATPRERLLAAYARWEESRGQDPEAFLALAGDEIEMVSVLSDDVPHAIAGDRHGIEAVRAYLEAIGAEWINLEFSTIETIVEGDRMVWVGRCRWRHKETGREINSLKVDIWHFRDGKATRFLEMYDTLGFARAVGMV